MTARIHATVHLAISNLDAVHQRERKVLRASAHFISGLLKGQGGIPRDTIRNINGARGCGEVRCGYGLLHPVRNEFCGRAIVDAPNGGGG